MQLRRKPFGEWVLIYFDKTKITEEALLSLAKNKGCKRAAIIRDKKKDLGKTSVTLMNPYICPGDSIALEISSDGSEKIELELPEGWSCKMPDTISGTATVFIKTTAKAKRGEFTVKFKNGLKSADLNCHIVEKIK